MIEQSLIEQAPKDNSPQRSVGPSPNSLAVPSGEIAQSFESQLFRNGTLEFDFDQYLAEAATNLTRKKDWYPSAHWDAKRALESLSSDIDDSRYEMTWRRRFSGQIPQQWHIWYNVRNDFEAAKRVGVQLSETLVNAGISHPHHFVANEVGKGQRLNIKQLAWLFARPDFPDWNRDQILAAQRRMGVIEVDIREATRIADEVKADKRKHGSDGYAPEYMPSEFPVKELLEEGNKHE